MRLNNSKNKPTSNLSDYDFNDSSVFGRRFEKRTIRTHNKKVKSVYIDFAEMSPEVIEKALEKALKYGCSYEMLKKVKADYHIWGMVSDRMRGMALIIVADQVQEIKIQKDGSLLSETDLAQIDLGIAKCEPHDEIAKRFGVDKSVIELREAVEQQSIIDLRRRLNSELEDSAIGLAHDFVRLEELQDTLEIIKAHIMEYESIRNRTDLSAEERLLRIASLPNIISLLNTKEKIISSAQKEMKARKDAVSAAGVDFDLSANEKEMFERLHVKFPIMELVVARASVDNGWDTAYMLRKLNESLYKKFRRGEHDDEYEIVKEKDMTIAYPSEQPINLDETIANTKGRDADNKLMTPRDRDLSEDKKNHGADLKKKLMDKIKAKKQKNEDSKDDTKDS